MNAATQSETMALSLPERAAVALRTGEHEIKLRELLTNSARIVAPANKAARDECHAAYMVLKNTRCSIVNLASEATEDAKAFTKAVKVESDRLIAITTAEEARLQGLRDVFDEQAETEKQAKIAAERARTDAIQAMIRKIQGQPLTLAGKSAADIAAWFDAENPDRDFDFMEFSDAAADAIAESLIVIRGMLDKARAAERIAAEAEAARIAEAERIAAEKIALVAERVENARIAAEQAAERQRLADAAAAQEAEAKKVREQAEAAAKAETARLAQIAADQQAAFDKQAAEMAAASRKLAEQQAAADARDAAAEAATKAAEAAAIAREQDDASREADHGPALMMNAEFDVARDAAKDAEAERVRLQAMAEQAVTDEHQPTSDLEALMESNADDGVGDAEIIAMVEAAFSMTREQAIDRLQAIDFDAARAA